MRRTALLALFLLPFSAAAADAEAGRTEAYTCLGCHGIPGYDNTYPTYKVPMIFGQHAQYLEAALRAYRSGERQHPTMNAQAGSLSDEAIADIAAYFSQAVTVSSGTPVGSEERATVCASCHMADGVSADPNNPILAGQYESYLAHTLRGYRDGTRANAIMAGMAAGLSDDDIDALAEYYANQAGLGDRAPE